MSLMGTVRKLADVLMEENNWLERGQAGSHAHFAEVKNQVFRELLAAQSAGLSEDSIMAISGDLKVLKGLLARNAVLLKNNIGALGEVTDIIFAGMRAEESDGTYSSRGWVR